MEETQFRVPGGPGQRGATTALIWVQRDDEVEDGVVYGTEGGYLVSWKEASRNLKGVNVCSCIAWWLTGSNRIYLGDVI
jgi:hypothetical protein